jgi:RND family efflux transporter MFP subunit
MSVARERPEGRNRNLIWAAAGIALLLLIGLGVWAYNASRPQPAAVVRRDIIAQAALNGPVVAPPDEQANVLAPFQAPVDEVLTTVGANVNRGDVLVKLSYPSAEAAYQQARQNVRTAETAYANAQRQYGAEVAAARRALAQAQAAEKRARETTAAAPPAGAEPGDVVPPPVPAPSGADLEAATQARIEAEQELAAAQYRLDAALVPYKQQLEVAREVFQQAQSGAKQAQVKSPINGTVLALNARPGEMVGKDPKVPIATIVDLDELQVHAEMPAEYATYVKKGMPVTLTVAEVPNEQFEGVVDSVVTQPKRGNKLQYLAIVDVENEKGLIKPGMKAQAGVKLGEAHDVLVVPSGAIRQDSSGRPVVHVLRGGQWQPVVVEVGLSDGQYTEIKGNTLKEGETVQVKKDIL